MQAECSRKTRELEESVVKANAEKQALLEQKEIVVQQLQQEKQVLQVTYLKRVFWDAALKDVSPFDLEQERLVEERRFSAATVIELAQLKEWRQTLECKLQDERLKFEEEKKLLVQQGTEAESRLLQLEKERAEREILLEKTRADLLAKEKEFPDIQVLIIYIAVQIQFIKFSNV